MKIRAGEFKFVFLIFPSQSEYEKEFYKIENDMINKRETKCKQNTNCVIKKPRDIQ